MIIGAVLNGLGGMIRCLGYFSNSLGLVCLFIGQCLAAIAQPCILGATLKFSAVWFGIRERTFATACGFLSNNFGIGLGYLIAPFIVLGTKRTIV